MGQWRLLSKITEIIIHCSATPNGKNFTAHDIDCWHAERGFNRNLTACKLSPYKHIGYHFVIDLNGSIEPGRGLDEIGAHCFGHNAVSIGICLIGTDRFTYDQWHALARLAEDLKRMNQFSLNQILGHRDTSPDKNRDGKIDQNDWLKTCPGFDVKDWLSSGMKPKSTHVFELRDRS
jgi:N-acetylmuramoyl-L-alanine amidase